MLEQVNSQFGVDNTRYAVHVVPYYLDDSSNVEGMSTYRTVFLPPLDDSSVVEFEMFQKMNEFMRTGHLTYVDGLQKLDPLFGKTISGIRVFITQFQSISPPGTSIPGTQMEFDMLVDRIDVVDRDGSNITYKIILIDRDSIALHKNVSFSGHGKDGKKNIGQIVSDLFKQSGLSFKESTASGIETNIDYITQANDNVMTAYRFLMRRDFFYENRSNSLNILTYNQNTSEYGFYNVKNPDMNWILSNGGDNVTNLAYLSLFDTTKLEEMLHKRQLDLETLSLKNRIDVINQFKDTTIKTFSVQGGWGSYTITSKNIQDLYSSGSNDENTRNRGLPDILDGYDDYGSAWATDMNLYEEQVDNLMNYDSLVLETDGHLNRIPGMSFNVLANPPQLSPEELSRSGSRDEQDQNNSKYSSFIGNWIISSVRHNISPSKGTFTDTICLFRNRKQSQERKS